MRGATLFFLALLVVVGSGRCVCLESNRNNVVIVEEDLLLAAELLKHQADSAGRLLHTNLRKNS